MRNAIIRLQREGRRPHGQNPGLLLQRYLGPPPPEKEGESKERRALLDSAIQSARDGSLHLLYRQAFDRWNRSFPEEPLHAFADLRTAGRLIVGLGSENVLETGIRLHGTYGVPILPGSALKGLSSHYCDRVWGSRHLGDDASDAGKAFRREGADAEHQYHKLLFGTTDDGGVIAFHDSWILPDSLTNASLMLDVMTPHHPRWQNNEAPPTDFDSPNPISFLSVSGTFRVRLSWAGPSGHPEAGPWTGLAMRLLKEALAEWGIGGKTSSGYGRLTPPAPSRDDARSPVTAPIPKRPARTPCKVTILEERKAPKVGFNVQEAGRRPGTLTLGSPPPGKIISVGDQVDVLIHNDEPQCPQYRWPDAGPAQPTAGTSRNPRRDSRR